MPNHNLNPLTGQPLPATGGTTAAGAAGAGTAAASGSVWPDVPTVEKAIHAGMNLANIATTNDAGFYAETHKGWHPLQDTWAQGLNPLSAPDPPTVSERCMIDCREREKLRKRECAEIRKRVQAKLKDLGCPSSVKSTDKATICGSSKKSKKEAPAKKKKKTTKSSKS